MSKVAIKDRVAKIGGGGKIPASPSSVGLAVKIAAVVAIAALAFYVYQRSKIRGGEEQ